MQMKEAQPEWIVCMAGRFPVNPVQLTFLLVEPTKRWFLVVSSWWFLVGGFYLVYLFLVGLVVGFSNVTHQRLVTFSGGSENSPAWVLPCQDELSCG